MDNNLYNSIYKRFQTTMIGALHQFEENFGELWGIDLPENQLTDTHLYYQNKWEYVRDNILNNGNQQMRKAMKEISSITSPQTKYSYKFTNRKGNNNNENKNI